LARPNDFSLVRPPAVFPPGVPLEAVLVVSTAWRRSRLLRASLRALGSTAASNALANGL
jgi:hypothetical protein